MSTFRSKASDALRSLIERLTPLQTIAFGYGLYMSLTFVALCFPISWKVDHVLWIDNLFTATSAVSTTGLATVSTPDTYNVLGQLIILIGIQIGGLGYMTMGSFAILASRGRVSESRLRIGKAVFSMPDHFEPGSFIRRAVIFCLGIELLGAVALYFSFSKAGVDSALWSAIFHSVSAFCTAGFSVFPNSLESFRADWWVNAVISILSLLGAIGFIVVSDLWLLLRVKAYSITLTSKIILIATFGGLLIAGIMLFFDPSLTRLPIGERTLAAFFQSMTALTTVGFNTHPIGSVAQASIIVLLVLMILGASPSGTGGGLKSTSWSAGLAAIWSMICGRKVTTFFGKAVPNYRIQTAFASFTLYLLVFAIGSFALLWEETHSFENVIFEAASALGTVGLSRGITGDLTDLGKTTIIALMFIGRVGVLSLALAALARKSEDNEDLTQETDLII